MELRVLLQRRLLLIILFVESSALVKKAEAGNEAKKQCVTKIKWLICFSLIWPNIAEYPTRSASRINVKFRIAMSKPNNCLLVLNQGENPSPEREDGLLVLPEKPALKRPSLYQVVMMNDDYTPMDFVVEVLMRFFSMNEEKAMQVMMVVHTQGKAVCGVYSRDIAETKATQVNQYSAECEHPLLCEIQKLD